MGVEKLPEGYLLVCSCKVKGCPKIHENEQHTSYIEIDGVLYGKRKGK